VIQIWLWEFPLPPQLQFLANPLGSAAATLAFWLLLALLLQLIVLRVLKAVARRTDSEVEDVVVDVSRRPLVLLIVILEINASLKVSGLDDSWLDRGQRPRRSGPTAPSA